MERAWLEEQLGEGRSIESIAREVGRHPSTVAYWARCYGLRSSHADRAAARGALSRDELAALVEEDLTVREIAARLDRSFTTVRHWLRYHGLETTASARRVPARSPDGSELRIVMRRCRRHGVTRHVRRGRSWRCSRCTVAQVAAWRRRLKERLVAEAGGSCVLCGYARCMGALQFHHLDPATKRFSLSHRGLARSYAEAREEAGKCVLLCANCHAEVEAGVTRLTGQCTGRG